MSWYRIENKADTKSAEVYLYDEIGGYGIEAQAFINELNGIDADSITVRVNSVGGEVFQGFAIYQALKDFDGDVTVVVDGLAASIASVIAMAGNKVVMARNAEFMIHDGHCVAIGNAAELTKTVAMLDRVSDNIASVYAERTGVGTAGDWREHMRAETWYSAEEAVKAGLADEVAPATKRSARNAAELVKVFNYGGRRLAPAPVIATPVETPEVTPEPAPFEWDTDLILNALKGAFDND